MRTIPANLLTHVGGQMLTLARCVKMTPIVGSALGFTSYDRNLTIGGLLYEATSSVDSTGIQYDEKGIERMEVVGILNSPRLTEADLLAGKYLGAGIEIFDVNYKDSPITDRALLLTGVIGEMHVRTGKYVAEIRGLSQRLKQQIGELTSPTCRVWQLGDERCKVNLASYQFTRTVASVTSQKVIVFGTDSQPAGDYNYGRVIWQTGPNAGFQMEIKSHTAAGGNATITLQKAMPYTVAAGHTAILEVGCNRTFQRCKDRFGNTVNFRAEPHLPGTDKVIQIAGRK